MNQISCLYAIISAHPSSRNDKHVVLKLYIRTPPGKVNRETSFYNHLHTISPSHPGSQHIRHAVDIFSLESTSGDIHECLVHLPLQTTLFAFQRPGGKPRPFPEELVKIVMKSLLESLDFLHTEANVTHCGKDFTTKCGTSQLMCISQI